jgi:hypothetical protein
MDHDDEVFEHAGFPIRVGAFESNAGHSWWYQIHGITRETRGDALPTRAAALQQGSGHAKERAERLQSNGGRDVDN